MKILLTGINGFVGAAIAAELSRENEIFGTGRKSQSGGNCTEYLQIDIGEGDAVSRIKERWKGISFDAVVHCAAGISEDASRLYRTNCYGTQNIADFAVQIGCPMFVYISGIPVIGQPCQLPITEEHPVCSSTVYLRTKYLGELIVEQTLAGKCGYKVLRFASPLGPAIPKNKIVRVILENCLKGQDIHIYGSGERVQNYIDVRDIARAVDCALSKKDPCGVFLISGHSLTDRELADLCRKVCRSSSKIIIGDPGKKEDRWVIDGHKALDKFGYAPAYTTEQTLEWMVKSWQI